MGVIKKVSRPVGIILISVIKITLIILTVIGILTIISRYDISVLKLEGLKKGMINSAVYYLFPKGNEVKGVLYLSGVLFAGVVFLAGMWCRKKWVWYLEVLFFSGVILMILITIFTINSSELKTMNEESIKSIGEICLVSLIVGFTFILYLTKKNVRDYFGIFKRRLR